MNLMLLIPCPWYQTQEVYLKDVLTILINLAYICRNILEYTNLRIIKSQFLDRIVVLWLNQYKFDSPQIFDYFLLIKKKQMNKQKKIKKKKCLRIKKKQKE